MTTKSVSVAGAVLPLGDSATIVPVSCSGAGYPGSGQQPRDSARAQAPAPCLPRGPHVSSSQLPGEVLTGLSACPADQLQGGGLPGPERRPLQPAGEGVQAPERNPPPLCGAVPRDHLLLHHQGQHGEGLWAPRHHQDRHQNLRCLSQKVVVALFLPHC